MARQQRAGPEGVPQHVIQRGNNRKACFICQQDYIAYITWLEEYSLKFDVAIHAWVLMTNHVHLLCTPKANNKGVSLLMQSLGRRYVRYFNDNHSQTGTLWEGRFKSSLVCSATYLMRLYQYVELNPVRANMVNDPSEYKWSSYQYNALGKLSVLCEPHSLYRELGATKSARLLAYKRLFLYELGKPLIDEIRRCSQKELVLGDDKFKEKIESMLNRKLKTGILGRPVSN